MANTVSKRDLLSALDRVNRPVLAEGGAHVKAGEQKAASEGLRDTGKGTEAELAARAHALASGFESKPGPAAYAQARALVGQQLDRIAVGGQVDLDRISELRTELRPLVRGLAQVAATVAAEQSRGRLVFADFATGAAHASALLQNAIPTSDHKLSRAEAQSVLDKLAGTERQAVAAVVDAVLGDHGALTRGEVARASRAFALDIVGGDETRTTLKPRELAELGGGQRAVGRLGMMISAGILPKATPRVSTESDGLAGLSMGQLAAKTVVGRFDRMVKSLEALSPTAMPHDPAVKAARKDILGLRNLLDLFAHVFPNSGPGDTWVDLRKTLDHGYERVGSFKDEFDSQGLTLAVKDPATGRWSEGVRPDQVTYDKPARVEQELDAVLKWKKALTPELAGFRAYLAKPNDGPTVERKKDELSNLFWGGVDRTPKVELSGLQNVARLVDAMADDVRGKVKDLLGFKDIVGGPNELLFHEARKQLRGALNLALEFPEVIRDPEAAKASTERLTGLVAEMGAIEDQLAAHAKGSKKERRKLEDEIRDAFKDLKKEIRKEDLVDVLKTFSEQLAR